MERYREKLIQQFDKVYNPAIHGNREITKENYINKIEEAYKTNDVCTLMEIGLNNEFLEGVNKEFINMLLKECKA